MGYAAITEGKGSMVSNKSKAGLERKGAPLTEALPPTGAGGAYSPTCSSIYVDFETVLT